MERFKMQKDIFDTSTKRLKLDELIDYKKREDWEKIQELLFQAVLKGYSRGLRDYRDKKIELSSIEEEVSEMNKYLNEYYFN